MISILLAIIAVSIWALICEVRTNRQRNAMIDVCHKIHAAVLRKRLDVRYFDVCAFAYGWFSSVPYQRHFWLVFTLRNPMGLYKVPEINWE